MVGRLLQVPVQGRLGWIRLHVLHGSLIIAIQQQAKPRDYSGSHLPFLL